MPSSVSVSVSASSSSSSSSSSASAISQSPNQQQELPKERVIIGSSGRIGNALISMLKENDDNGSNGAVEIIEINSSNIKTPDIIPKDGKGPIYVCTRNNVLEDIINLTPDARKEDLVFLQNGMLMPFLSSYGLEKNTQVLVFFAVSKLGETPIDGITDQNPEGLTAANGKWANDIATILKEKGQLKCHVLENDAFQQAMYEKLIWICSMMLIGQTKAQATGEAVTVGDVEAKYKEEVSKLIIELKNGLERCNVCSIDKDERKQEGQGISDQEVVDRLLAYSRSVAHFPTGVKEIEWRNGYFLDLSKKMQEEGKEDPFPYHSQLMKEIL